MKKRNGILKVCTFAFVSNLLLFLVKLYVGLCSNSISIFSDAVNNLFDSLSGLLTLVCLAAVMRSTDLSTESSVKKSEQLLSFVMSVIVAGAGLYFAYSSLERLMYPTPVWYAEKYLIMLILTAVVKLMMWLIYRVWSKKISSPVIKVMSVDCVLDFFITCGTVLTLILSKNESYAVDAVFGIVISTVIVISAVKMIISWAGKLVNYVPEVKRKTVESAIEKLEKDISVDSVTYYLNDDSIDAYIKIKSENSEVSEEKLQQVKNDCKKDAQINVFFIKS